MADEVVVSVPARVGLLGNPGDGYGGRTIAFTVAELAAEVTAAPAEDWDVGVGDGSILLQAAVRQMNLPVAARLAFTTTIPRQMGLAGSSAIIIAAMRAIAVVNDHSMDPVELAKAALEAETRFLQVTAGPQDRVIQAYGGMLDMDFAEPWDAASYRRLDPGLLPEGIFVAWKGGVGESSGTLHSDVRRRWDANDGEVRAHINRFRHHAERGLAAMQSDDAGELADVFDASFASRSALWSLSQHDRDMVALAKRHGAGAKFCGSGGAIVGVLRDAAGLADLQQAFTDAGYGFLVPTVGPPHA